MILHVNGPDGNNKKPTLPIQTLNQINANLKKRELGTKIQEALNNPTKTELSPEKKQKSLEIANKYLLPFGEFKANKNELAKLNDKERQQYNELFDYTNSKSHGLDPKKDAQIEQWNKTHPDCQIRSQYDK